MVVGSAVTANRLFSSGLAASPLCRYCEAHVETIGHLVECPALPAEVGPPPRQRESQGPAFYSHALPEIPPDLVAACCTLVEWPAVCPGPVFPVGASVHLWTDGSVFLPQHPFFAAAGFAVVSSSRVTVASGPVPGVFADNYRAEVYAILRAAQLVRGPLTVHTDSQSAVSAWASFCSLNRVPTHVAAADIWQLLWEWLAPLTGSAFLCTGSVGMAVQTLTCPVGAMHAVCNHAADVAAKHAARAALRVDGSRLHALFYAAYRRHLWLQRLLAALPRTRVAVAAPADVDAQPSPLPGVPPPVALPAPPWPC